MGLRPLGLVTEEMDLDVRHVWVVGNVSHVDGEILCKCGEVSFASYLYSIFSIKYFRLSFIDLSHELVWGREATRRVSQITPSFDEIRSNGRQG